MKITAILAFIVFLTLAVAVSSLRASSPDSPLEIISPSHPATFYVSGNEKLGQDLTWDDKVGMLKGNVTYSIVMGSGDELIDPANYTTFGLPFPTIRLSPNKELYVLANHQKVAIGRLEEGAFGTQVHVYSGVKFVAHRVEGSLRGEIIVSHSPSRNLVR